MACLTTEKETMSNRILLVESLEMQTLLRLKNGKLYWLANLCNAYTPADIFNMDKTGYFDCALPNSMLNQVSKSCKGGNMQRIDLQLL